MGEACITLEWRFIAPFPDRIVILQSYQR